MSVSMDIDKGRGGGTDVALEGLEGPIYKCKHCQAPLALSQHVVSKSFLCKEGKGYLFSKVVNVSLGEKEERTLLTGVYTVADVSCISCGSIIGWKYEIVQEEKDKYKEGKFILERATGEDTRAPKDAFEDINNVHDSSSTNEPLTAPTEEFDAIPTSSRTRTTTADGSGNQAKKKRKVSNDVYIGDDFRRFIRCVVFSPNSCHSTTTLSNKSSSTSIVR